MAKAKIPSKAKLRLTLPDYELARQAERKLARRKKATYQENEAIFTAMYVHARETGALSWEDPRVVQDRIDLAKALRSLTTVKCRKKSGRLSKKRKSRT